MKRTRARTMSSIVPSAPPSLAHQLCSLKRLHPSTWRRARCENTVHSKAPSEPSKPWSPCCCCTLSWRCKLVCSCQWLLPSTSSTGLVGTVDVVAPAAQQRRRTRSLSSGSSLLQHAHCDHRSLTRRGWRAKLVDAPCLQATLYAAQRLHTAGRYPSPATVRVGPVVDAVPRAVNRLNMVPTKVTYRS